MPIGITPALPLQGLIANGLIDLNALHQAATAPFYQIGRDDYNATQLMADGLAVIEAQTESKKATTAHENITEFPGNEQAYIRRLGQVLEGHTSHCPEESIVIKGPIDAGVISGVTEACRYLVTQGRNFSMGPGAVKKLLIKCDLPSLDRIDGHQTVMSADSETSPFSISYYGFLPDRRHFHLGIMTNLPPLADVLNFQNDFSFATTRQLYRPGQWKADQGDGIYDVHLNGPETNPVMRDLIRLGESIRQYLLGHG